MTTYHSPNQPGVTALDASRELPPETNARFTLLITSVIFLTVHMAVIVVIALGLLGPSLAAQIGAIGETSAMVAQGGSILDLAPAERIAYAAQQQQLAITGLLGLWPAFVIPALALVVLWVGAHLIYRTHPRRVLRGLSATTVTAHDLPMLFNELDVIAPGIQHLHIVASDQTNSARVDRVFGFPGQYHMLIFGKRSLVEQPDLTRFFKLMWNKNHFRAGMLHEIAHIRNGDVWRGYFSDAIWWAFILLVIVPGILLLILSSVLTGAPATLLWMLPRVLLLVAGVFAIWAELLRVREHYADWWASERPGMFQELQRTLNATRKQRNESAWDRFWRRTPWSAHPHTTLRLEYITAPTRLFRVSVNLAMLAGLMFAILTVGMALIATAFGMLLATGSSIVVYWLVPTLGLPGAAGQSDPLGLLMLIGGVVVPALLILVTITFLPARLVTGVLGTQIQREQLADSRHPAEIGPYISLLGRALLFTAGLVTGLLVMPLSFFAPRSTLGVAVTVLLSLVFIGCMWVWMVYVRLLSARWLIGPVERMVSRARTVTLIATWALTILLWTFLTPLIGVVYDERVVDAMQLGARRDEFVRFYLGGTAIFPPFFFMALFVLYAVVSLLLAPRERTQQALAATHALPLQQPPLVDAAANPARVAQPLSQDRAIGSPTASNQRASATAVYRHPTAATAAIILLGLGSLICFLSAIITLVLGRIILPPANETALTQALWQPIAMLIPAGCGIAALVLTGAAIFVGWRYRKTPATESKAT